MFLLLSTRIHSMETNFHMKKESVPKPKQEVAETPWYELDDETLSNRYIKGTSLLDIKTVYEGAPPIIKGTVEHLKDPYYFDIDGMPEYRHLFLSGPPGSGKSTIAKAIARYAGWDLKFKTPADVQKGDRNNAALNLKKMFKKYIDRGTPTLFVIDEINQLLENYESDKHDNDATSKSLWTQLDKLPGLNNFFFIGITNRLDRIPPQIKSRIKSSFVVMSGPRAAVEKIKMVETIFKRKRIFFENDAAQAAFLSAWEKNPHWTGRDITHMAADLRKGAMVGNLGPELQKVTLEAKQRGERDRLLINDGMVNKMACNAIQAEDYMDYKREELTDEDRQDLYQGISYYIQVYMQRWQKHGMFGLRTPGMRSDDANILLDNVLSRNIKRMMDKLTTVNDIKNPRLI